MEDFWIWLGICALLLAALYRLSRMKRRHKKKSKKTPLQDTPSPDEQTNEIIKNYYLFDDSPLMRKLQRVKSTDPDKRRPDRHDKWFKEHIQELCHNGYCLGYIDTSAYRARLFWKTIDELQPEICQDLQFQRLLISLQGKGGFGTYFPNFSSMLFTYATRCPLLPELVKVLETDERFKRSREYYERGRAYGQPFMP